MGPCNDFRNPFRSATAKSQITSDQHFYESKCAALDRQLDGLVYELTTEEIAIVEASSEKH